MPEIDIFLWSRVQSGDKEAFQILFEKYYPVLCLISRRYTHDIETSREIIQVLFVHLWENRTALNINLTLKNYLYQSARFNSIRRINQDKRVFIHQAVKPELENDQVFSDHIEYAELQEKIVRTIDALPEQCKRVFKMSRFEQLKQVEIAVKLGISIKTVESHISKALRVLEEKLQGDFI